MRFNRGYGSAILVVICIIIATTLNYQFLELDYSLSESYFLGMGISIIIFVIASFIMYFIVRRFKQVEGMPVSNVTSVLAGKNIIFDVIVDEKKERVTCFQSNKHAKLNKKETLYLSKRNVLYRKNSIMLFKPITMLIILLIGIGIIILGLNSHDLFIKLDILYKVENVNDSFGHIILFKFINMFLLASVLLFYNAIMELIIGKNKVEATVVKLEEVEVTEELPGKIEYHNSNVDRIVLRYMWNGEPKTYAPLVNNSLVKRIGTSVNLYVDENGDVIGESTDVGFFFLGGFISFVFYIVFLFTFLSDIF